MTFGAHAGEVLVYGLGHVSADNVDDGQTSSYYVASNSSRLGLSGSYRLSPSLEVIFQYETGVDLTAQGFNDGNGDANSQGQILTKGRDSYVGLSGNFGKVLIGHIPALDQWANDYNLFADQVGDLGNLWEGSGIPGRLDNVIYYQAPTFSGANVALSYVPEEGKEDSDNLIIKGNYEFSGLKMGVAYASIGQGDVILQKHRAMALTFGYDFERFSIGGGFQAEHDIAGVSGVDRDSYNVGVKVQIGQQGVLKSQIAISSGDQNNSDARQIAIGYDYLYDKNTTLYIAYAQTDNDENVNFSVNGKGHGDKIVPFMGKDPSALSIGIVAKFDLTLNY